MEKYAPQEPGTGESEQNKMATFWLTEVFERGKIAEIRTHNEEDCNKYMAATEKRLRTMYKLGWRNIHIDQKLSYRR